MDVINYRLISAVREGNLEKTRDLINSYGLSYSPAWSEGYTLLFDAVKNNHSAVAKLLLTSGAKITSKNKKPSDTLLHFAVKNGDAEIITMILDRGAYIDAKNQQGETSLLNAIENRKKEIVELLLKRGANVNDRGKDGKNLLHVAAYDWGKCPEIVKQLLNYGACVNCVCTSTWGKGNTPLHFAVESGSKEVTTLLLSKGANVDAKNENRETPLHIAAKKRCVKIAEELLNHGASTHSLTSKGYTPLHFSSKLGDEEKVELFLNKGADVNARTMDNLTPLHIATKEGCKAIVRLLLQHGAKVDNRDEDGNTILYLAVEKGYLEVVEIVLKYCPDINIQSNKNSLKIAVNGPSYREDYKKITVALLEYGFTVDPEDANDPKLLHAAVEKGYFKIVEDLLKNGADVNALHNLHIAAKNKQEEVAKLLISHGADINARDDTGKTPIMYAITEECIEIVKALLQQDIDINASDPYGETALHYTSFSGNLGIPDFLRCLTDKASMDTSIRGEIVKLLLSKGANVDAKTAKGATTLVVAVLKGYANIVEALLEYNANVNPEVVMGYTLLHISAQIGNKEICIMLLNKGVNINAKEEKGYTALHIATQKGYKEIVKLLLDRGATVDSKNVSGLTPLRLGVQKGDPKIIETILKFGANINSVDECGRTALHIASLEGHEKAVATLLEYDADINISCRDDGTPLDYVMSGERQFFTQQHKIRCSYDNCYCEYYEDTNPFKLTAKTLKSHLMKMRTANLYVSEENLLSMVFSFECDIGDFQTDCKKEIAIMKREKIDSASISFYDVLTKATSSLAIFMKNENIVHVLETGDYKTKFPIYASIIGCHFKRAMERKKLLEPANKISRFLFNSFPELTCGCIEKIFSFLSNKEIRILIDTCKFLSGNNSKSNVEEEVITSTLSQVQLV